MRHDETWKLETETIQDIRVETEQRLRHEKPCLDTVSREDTSLETPSPAAAAAGTIP